ncbi:WXG100 family type VII secretion target [Lentzea sp. JNUCC 0626]|uniref:WXG100 family type VII secretion target n=1 Tax=Lentzea sp. JNUCC 0626 TaxID=3367513 RepID=UPI003749E42B
MTAAQFDGFNAPFIDVNSENAYKGSLFVEAFAGLVDSISVGAETETEKALDITFNAIGAASSIAMVAADPLGAALGAGIGWLIEHISFIREGLDQLMGDPEAINANVEATQSQAVSIRALVDEHRQEVVGFGGWTGAAFDRFQASMTELARELEALAGAVETKAKIVSICGLLVSLLRDIVRDMIAQFLGSLLAGALIAAASAAITFGASIAGFVGYAVGKGIALAVNIVSRISRLVAAIGRQLGRIRNLDDVIKKLGKNWDRFENVADVAEVAWEGYKAVDRVDRAVNTGVAEAASGYAANKQ